MRRRLGHQQGFSLVEAMVAILLITVGALALASTFVGAAEQTRRASMRTKALEAASQELDRLRSIP
jgi:prepilin-type N-terminal cleavage/methylation domain-containing protein